MNGKALNRSIFGHKGPLIHTLTDMHGYTYEHRVIYTMPFKTTTMSSKLK